MVDDGLDVIWVAQAGNKDAIGTGLEISFAALKVPRMASSGETPACQ